jgi:hypothetical protein
MSTKFDRNFDNFCNGFWLGMTRKEVEKDKAILRRRG